MSKISWPRTDNRSLSRKRALHASLRDLWVKTSRTMSPESFGRSGSSPGGASKVGERARLRLLVAEGSGVDSMTEGATL